MVALDDDSGSDLEILSEKVVTCKSTVHREILIQARQQRSKPVVNIGIDDDQHDNIEFSQFNNRNKPKPAFPIFASPSFPISSAYLDMIRQNRKKSNKSYFSGRLSEKRNIEVVDLDSNDEEELGDCSSGSSNGQGETRTCTKQGERLTTDPSKDSYQTLTKRARN